MARIVVHRRRDGQSQGTRVKVVNSKSNKGKKPAGKSAKQSREHKK